MTDAFDEEPELEEETPAAPEAEAEVEDEPVDDEYVPKEDNVVVHEISNRIPDNERITYNKLTKYERTRLITSRCEQLAQGAAPMVDVEEGMTVVDIAIKELNERKIPLLVRRILKDNKFEEWRVDELIF